MTKLQAEIIVALADNRLNVSDAGRELFMHRSTVCYHVKKVHEQTGKNPLEFYDMCALLPRARAILGSGVDISAETWQALSEMGRKAHGEGNND